MRIGELEPGRFKAFRLRPADEVAENVIGFGRAAAFDVALKAVEDALAAYGV